MSHYTLRHTDYINMRFTGHDHLHCDTIVAMLSPKKEEWRLFDTESEAQTAIWKVRSLRTSQSIDKTANNYPDNSKWVIEKDC